MFPTYSGYFLCPYIKWPLCSNDTGICFLTNHDDIKTYYIIELYITFWTFKYCVCAPMDILGFSDQKICPRNSVRNKQAVLLFSQTIYKVEIHTHICKRDCILYTPSNSFACTGGKCVLCDLDRL